MVMAEARRHWMMEIKETCRATAGQLAGEGVLAPRVSHGHVLCMKSHVQFEDEPRSAGG